MSDANASASAVPPAAWTTATSAASIGASASSDRAPAQQQPAQRQAEERAVHSAAPSAGVVGEVRVDALEVVAERLDALERRAEVARQRHQAPAERVDVGGLHDEHAVVDAHAAREALADQLARERLRRAAGGDAQRARPVANEVADRARLALGHETAVDEHDDAGRHALDLVQHVRGDEHRAALGAEPPDQLDDVPALHGVEAVERLVEQQQLGRVHERLGQLDALAHALREAADLAFGGVLEAHARERLGGGAAADRARRAGRPSARPARAR